LPAAPAATAAAFIFGAIEAAAFGLFPVFALREGWGAGAAAIATAIFALGNALFQIPTGLAADRFGRRRLLILMGALGTLGALILPLAARSSYASYVALLFVWSGIVGGLYAVGLTSLACRLYSSLYRGDAGGAADFRFQSRPCAGRSLLQFGFRPGTFLRVGDETRRQSLTSGGRSLRCAHFRASSAFNASALFATRRAQV
jgi:MFS family permease